MCGIAGIIDLSGERRPAPAGAMRAMAEAICPSRAGRGRLPRTARHWLRLAPPQHRRPGRRPAADPQRRRHRLGRLQRRAVRLSRNARPSWKRRGHRFRTHCDTELIPHLLGRSRRRHVRTAARPVRRRPVGRTGASASSWPAIASASVRSTGRGRPAGDWLLFASEIKALLASGMVRGPARSARHQSPVHLLRPARPGHLLRGRAAAAAGPLPAHPARRDRRAGPGQRDASTGKSISPTRPGRLREQRPAARRSSFEASAARAR